MHHARGYALLETLLASIVLATGLISVASIFSVTAAVNIRNRQRTTATLLVYDKMEQLESSGCAPGGGLDPSNPVSGYAEYIESDNGINGTMTVNNANLQAPYLRLWEVEGTAPALATIKVYARIGAMPALELARATGSLNPQ